MKQDTEFVAQEISGEIILIPKPKESLSLSNWEEWYEWKNITLYPYSSSRESMPFMSMGNKVLYRYNYEEYRNITFFDEICNFLDVEWETLYYHLKKIKKESHYHLKGNRTDFDRLKKFKTVRTSEEHILIIPYETFWALLESYKSQISKDILKNLHRIDAKRELEDENNQTLIAQIKGEESDFKRLYKQLDKCETDIQRLAFPEIFRFFRRSTTEYWFWTPKKDNKKRDKWRLDIILHNLRIAIEFDGKWHRFDDKRFEEDEKKDTELLKEGIMPFRRSNDWWWKYYKEAPYILCKFLEKFLNK